MEPDVSVKDRCVRDVLLLTPEDVTRRNGEVHRPGPVALSELRRSQQCKSKVVFKTNMSPDDVKRRLEEAFPVLISKR